MNPNLNKKIKKRILLMLVLGRCVYGLQQLWGDDGLGVKCTPHVAVFDILQMPVVDLKVS